MIVKSKKVQYKKHEFKWVVIFHDEQLSEKKLLGQHHYCWVQEKRSIVQVGSKGEQEYKTNWNSSSAESLLVGPRDGIANGDNEGIDPGLTWTTIMVFIHYLDMTMQMVVPDYLKGSMVLHLKSCRSSN